MKLSKILGWGSLVAILFVVNAGWNAYNGMVETDEQVTTEQAQIETQLQRRFDLIPNLMQAVRGTMAQERAVFGEIAQARTRYASAENTADQLAANSQLSSALGRLLMVMENYPELKSAAAVQDLMTQLEGSENRISVARQRYNESVQIYNLRVKRIPGKWFAWLFGFDPRTKFETEPGSGADKAPVVNLE